MQMDMMQWLWAGVALVLMILALVVVLRWGRSSRRPERSKRLRSHAKGSSLAHSPGPSTSGPMAHNASVDPMSAHKHREAALSAQQSGNQRAAAEEFARSGDTQKAVRLWVDLGEHRRAAEVMEKAGHFLQAGLLYQQADAYLKAIECLEASKEPVRAAPLLREIGEVHRALALEATAALSGERLEEAATLFLEAGQFQRAGELWLKLEDHERCVEAFRRAGQVHQAAQLLEEHGHWAWAGALFEESEKWEDAARCFETADQLDDRIRCLAKGDNVCRAVRLLHRERRFEESLELLNSVTPLSSEYAQVSLLKGGVLERFGRLGEASAAYTTGLKTVKVDVRAVPLFIRVARVQEGAGLIRAAIATITRVITSGLATPEITDWARRMANLVTGTSDFVVPESEFATEETMGFDGEEPSSGLVPTLVFQSAGSAKNPEVGEEQAPGVVLSETLGRRYRLDDPLGQGGNGVVYGGYDRVLQKEVAIKFIISGVSMTSISRDFFIEEVRLAAKLTHPNIVGLYDVGEADGMLYFTMEKVQGGSLGEIVQSSGGVLSHERVAPILAQLCDALDYAHDRQIVHRDIKPGNVMVTEDQQVKLLDFGIATAIDECPDQAFVVCGTPYFMSPEQIGRDFIDHRTDVYSLGCLLYVLYTGNVPFPDGNVYDHHRNSAPPNPCERVESLPQPIGSILMRCLAKDRADRFQRAGEVSKALTAI
jgi:tetratricopeptide (TPR) repeat protein/predicted Ser/Thr protein kinase